MPADPFTVLPVGEIPTQNTTTRNGNSHPKPPTSPQQQLHTSPPQPQARSPSPPTSTSASTPTTPLHQRFLNQVHTPLSPSTPPLTPRSESTTRSRSVSPRKQILELGQSAFYFTCEVPNRGSPRKTASPKKGEGVQMRPISPDKSAGRVKDILRRNLFGAPALKIGGAGKGGGADGGAGVGKGVRSPGRISPTRASPTRVSPTRMGVPSRHIERNAEKDGGTTLDQRKESCDDKKDRGTLGDGARTNQLKPSNATEPAAEVPPAAEMAIPRSPESPKEPLSSEPAPSKDPSPPLLPMANSADTMTSSTNLSKSPRETRKSTLAGVVTNTSPEVCTPQTQGVVKPPGAFRSDIGALMANLRTTTPDDRKPADVGGVEGMPTPLRKASEKLFGQNVRPLDSSWKGHDRSMKENEQPGQTGEVPQSPTPRGSDSLGPARSDMPGQTSARIRVDRVSLTPASGSKRPQSMFLDRTPWSQHSAGGSSSAHSRSDFAKTTSPGTPNRVRSSIQREMDQMRESLHTSLGSGTGSARTGSVVDSPTAQSKVETPCLKPTASGGNGHNKLTEKVKGNRPVSQIIGRPQSAFAKYAARKADNDEPPKRAVRATQSPAKARPQSMVMAPVSSAGTVRGPRMQPSEKQPSERKTVTARPKSMVILPAPARTEVVVRTTKAAALRQKAAQAIVPKNQQPSARTATTKEPDTVKVVPPRQRTQAQDTKDVPPRLVPRKPVTSTRCAAPATVTVPSGRKTPSTTPTPLPKSPSKPYLVSRKPVPPPATIANPKRTAAPTINTNKPNYQPRPRVASAEQIAGQIAQWHNEDRKKATSPKPRPAPRVKAPITPHKRPSSPTKRHLEEEESDEEKSYTPLGLPTKLRAPAPSPMKPRSTAAAPTTPAKKLPAHPVAAFRAPKTPVHRTGAAAAAGGPGGGVGNTTFDPNALRTPSKEIQSALDRAIDAKIAEDARSGREFTPSGNRISDLLARRMG
jgi:hypothetical protein